MTREMSNSIDDESEIAAENTNKWNDAAETAAENTNNGNDAAEIATENTNNGNDAALGQLPRTRIMGITLLGQLPRTRIKRPAMKEMQATKTNNEHPQTEAMQSEIASRFVKAIVCMGSLALIGIAYVYAVRNLGFGIRCPFEAATGFLCPGCGITGMILSLLAGNPREAFQCNQLTFCLIPILTALVCYLIYRYIKHGNLDVPQWIEITVICLVVIYIAWGIIRNLMVF